MGHEIGVRKVDGDSLPEWTGKLGLACVPRFVWIMETQHENGGNESIDSVRAKIQEKMPFMPPELLEKLATDVHARLTGTGAATGEAVKRSEYHVLVVAENLVEKKLEIVVSQAHTHMDGEVHKLGVNVMDTEKPENYPLVYASARATCAAQEYRPDWNGKRVTPAFAKEANTLAEMDAAIAGTQYESAWKMLIPREIESIATAELEESTPEVAEITAKNRAALVKRFGKNAIATLEKRIKERKKEGNEK